MLPLQSLHAYLAFGIDWLMFPVRAIILYHVLISLKGSIQAADHRFPFHDRTSIGHRVGTRRRRRRSLQTRVGFAEIDFVSFPAAAAAAAALPATGYEAGTLLMWFYSSFPALTTFYEHTFLLSSVYLAR